MAEEWSEIARLFLRSILAELLIPCHRRIWSRRIQCKQFAFWNSRNLKHKVYNCNILIITYTVQTKVRSDVPAEI